MKTSFKGILMVGGMKEVWNMFHIMFMILSFCILCLCHQFYDYYKE